MKRILLVVIVLVLLLVAGIVVLPFFFKDDIVNYLKSETINGQISFNEDISIGLISTFPDLNIGIKDIVITNNAPFEGDTLLSLKELKATVDLMQIISGNIEVKSIDLNTPYVNVLIKADETANYDIALPSEEEEVAADETESEAFSFKLSSLTVSNGKINYFDTSLATYTTLKGFNFKMSGLFNEESMDIQTTTSAESFTCDFEGIKYLKKAKLDYVADLVLYLNEEKYAFKENELMLNDLGLSFDGTFQFVGEDMLFDMTYGLTKSEFKSLLSMVPSVFAADFAGLQASGTMAFDGHMKGLMTETEYPEFSLNLSVENGAFQYPDLPSALNNTQVKMAITNPGGSFDNTVVEISKCHIELDKEPFDMMLMLKNPDTDPYVAAKLLGSIDLERVSKLIPLEGVSVLKGIVNANLEAKGRMSAIENENYDQFYAAGEMSLNQFAYQDADLPDLVEIPNAQFEFTPAYADLKNMDLKLGKSDLKFSGKIENYMPYLFHDKTIVGSMSLTGNYLDLNPWLTEEASTETTAEETTEDDYELEVIEIPANINFVFTSLIEKVKYDNYDIEKMRGQISVKDQILTFTELGLNMLGGSMVVNGNYNSQNLSKPTSDFAFTMTNVSIPGMYETFMTVREMLPIAKQMTGSINGNMAFSSTLGSDFMPVLESVNGKAKLDIERVELVGNKIWNKAVDYLGWEDGMKKLIITKIKPNFKIVNGDIFLDTFNFKIKNQDFDFGGKSSLNQTIDFALDTKVPTKGASKMAEGLISEATKNKINVDLADEIDLRFKIFGNMLDPEFKPVVMGADGKGLSLKDQAKETAKELINDGKKQAVAKGKEELRKQAEKLKQEAQVLKDQAAKLKAEAATLSKKGDELKAESEKLKKEADAQKAKIEKEMASLPKIARDKAMIPVNSLFDKATSKLTEANKYFDLAKKPEQEADKLLQKANDLEKKADDLLKE